MDGGLHLPLTGLESYLCAVDTWQARLTDRLVDVVDSFLAAVESSGFWKY